MKIPERKGSEDRGKLVRLQRGWPSWKSYILVASILFWKHETRLSSENTGDRSLKFEESRGCMKVTMEIRLKRLFFLPPSQKNFKISKHVPLNGSFVEYNHLFGD